MITSPLYIFLALLILTYGAGSYENTNYLREREELRPCTKSHMIHVQNHIWFTYKITYDSRDFPRDLKSWIRVM